MIVGAAVMPAAPILLPRVAAGAAGELEACREAIDAALTLVLQADPDDLVVVGSGRRTCWHEAGATGSLRGIGIDEVVPLAAHLDYEPHGDASLALSLTVGAWLLGRVTRRHAWTGSVRALEVAAEEEPQVCLGAGAGLADTPRPRVLVVVADGSARRGPTAPGYTDPRASHVDQTWLDALARADPAALARLDPFVAQQLMMDGRAPLQVLAGAAAGSSWHGEVLFADDPYGVQYAVATWLPDG